ncbi:hypothetical protein TNCV_1505141 [Trichonephila clavipes]|nr:hypothetical protein TNCV_1505141 [Trichonephila clavipes]
MPPVQRCQTETHKTHRGKELIVRVSLAVALGTIQVTVRSGSVPPNFEGEQLRGVREAPPLFPFNQPH